MARYVKNEWIRPDEVIYTKADDTAGDGTYWYFDLRCEGQATRCEPAHIEEFHGKWRINVGGYGQEDACLPHEFDSLEAAVLAVTMFETTGVDVEDATYQAMNGV